MAPRSGIRLAAAAVLTAAAWAMTMPGASFAATPSDGESLIAVDPLLGYVVAEGSKYNGVLDAKTLLELAGANAADVHAVSGQARTWSNDAGATAVAFLIDFGDVGTAADFLEGAISGSTTDSDSTFDPGIAGSAGFTVAPTTDAGPLNIVIWRQGTYYVEVFVIAATGGTSDAKAIAASEAAFLRSSTGAVPAANVASSSSDRTDSSVAYQVGSVIGTACLVGLVIFLIRNGKRRREEREAYKARVATPPPVFPPHMQTPATSEGSAWERVPPSPPPPH